mmetsp:Transcript_8161/g.19581  ORF Transcript_8161/g.19581 Transcript_8161/m.19581 type:complete len:80 (+) Transcript_8161:730-969(+)
MCLSIRSRGKSNAGMAHGLLSCKRTCNSCQHDWNTSLLSLWLVGVGMMLDGIPFAPGYRPEQQMRHSSGTPHALVYHAA